MKTFFFKLFLLIAMLIMSGANTFTQPLPPGTYSIGTGGYFVTIQAAFNKLGTDGISGNVTLELIDNLYTAPTDSFGFKLNGPIPGAGPNSRVTIKPASSKNVTIEGSGGATLSFLKTRYLTIDGVGLSGPTTLTIRSLVEGQFTWINSTVFFPPAAHNIVENVTFNNENFLKGVGLAFMSFVSTTSPLDSNLIQNNFIKKASIGIYISGWSGIAETRYNIVRGNIIGSETDSLITWGIQIEGNDNSIIENNRIDNIKQQFALNIITHGINIVGGNSSIVRNNVVHKVRSHLLYGSTGILLSGDGTFGFGTNNQVYNNMVYDIQSTSVNANSRIAGIQLWYQSNPKIYYNSVYLSGIGGSSPGGSAALFIVSAGTVTNFDVKNNIFVNTRDDSPYCASSICDYSSAIFTSDYNDLYYDDTNPDNCLVKIGANEYLTLANWQLTGKDIHSITEMPYYILPDLHIDFHVSTSLDGHATPIPGIIADIDGEPRNEETPDIGADEIALSITFSQLAVNVIDGWNMVSIPGLNSPDQNVNTWWAYRDQLANVFRYANGYQSVTNATPRTGYWMKHAGARTYNTGEEWPSGGIQTVTHSPIPGNMGWNLIGGYELSVTAANVTTNPPGLQSGPIYKYSGGYQVATTIDPGYGYWMKLNSAGQIIIPESLAKDGKPVEYFAEDWGRIVLTDAAGVSYTLYAVKGAVDLSQYELPPAPPAGMFDIRFGSGRIAEDLSSAIQIIEMQGITYPIVVWTEGLTITLQDETGKIINGVLSQGEELTINNSSINKLVILSAEVEKNIPTVYLLEQNYPNPFNPSTRIRYSLPQSSNVELKVFDILGNEIETLVNEEKQIGTYEITWYAEQLPSGVYFYQLKAGSFVETKKMILLK